MTGLVCFAHGKESGPWGKKITRLGEVAQRRGWRVDSPDYRFTRDPDERVAHLQSLDYGGEAPLVLVGSSMGGYVSAVVSNQWRPAGLFLMAPALYMPGYEADVAPRAEHVAVVHGWRDDIVPVDKSLEYARRYRAECHLLDSGHTLNDQLPLLGVLFEAFLATVED
ncbi:alpha/beta hydrolase [Ectothiorhodospiraceae bacterium WFHF3C12]|nr:alpha/beta hydrolase [Ectothiorhodospiraceae bacterium WFHF3C12]